MHDILRAHGIEFIIHPWIEIDGMRLVPDMRVGDTFVEVNGCYWHCCPVCGRENHNETWEKEALRLERLRTVAPVIVIWEHELDDVAGIVGRWKK